MLATRICLTGWLGYALLAPGLGNIGYADNNGNRTTFWVDLYRGEPVPYEAILDDLAAARVIYLGERHTLGRHHAVQSRILSDLVDKGLRPVLALEQLESRCRPVLDQYNRGEIDFDRLAELTEWPKQWRNYRQYQPILEAARRAGAPAIALNARRDTIRQVFLSGGVAKLPPEARSELPADMHLDDPPYEKLLGMQMQVHMAATPERLRPMIEAQIARDEAMAATLAAYLDSPEGKGRTAVVICGAGHVAYGLGTADRVRRRMPGLTDRIVLLSESGDVELTPEEKAASRDIEITHQQLRAIHRPIADYLHITALKPQDSALEEPTQ